MSEFKNDYSLIHLLLQINKYLQLPVYDRDGETKCSYTYRFKDIYVKLKDGKVKPSVGFLNQLRKKLIFITFQVNYEIEMEMTKLFPAKDGGFVYHF